MTNETAGLGQRCEATWKSVEIEATVSLRRTSLNDPLNLLTMFRRQRQDYQVLSMPPISDALTNRVGDVRVTPHATLNEN